MTVWNVTWSRQPERHQGERPPVELTEALEHGACHRGSGAGRTRSGAGRTGAGVRAREVLGHEALDQ